jgi:quercetin dioxygenase-like cupin family protein
MPEVEFIDLTGKIQEDARGFSFFPFKGRSLKTQDLFESFHLISIRPGQVRGNHLHPGHVEWLYAFHGPGLLLWEAEPGQVRERELRGGDTLVRIPPGVAHALRNPGPKILYLLAWREAAGPEPPEQETLARPVLPK